MNKLKIEWIERTMTKTGKAKADATLVDEKGVSTDKVTIWGDFPDFEKLMPGQEIFGEINVKQNGAYTNKTLYAGRTDTINNPKAPAWATGGNKGGIKAAQERKEVMIEKAQARKNDSIAYFNANNSAISVLGKYEYSMDLSGYRDQLVQWRDWFLSEWEKYDAGDKGVPFN